MILRKLCSCDQVDIIIMLTCLDSGLSVLSDTDLADTEQQTLAEHAPEPSHSQCPGRRVGRAGKLLWPLFPSYPVHRHLGQGELLPYDKRPCQSLREGIEPGWRAMRFRGCDSPGALDDAYVLVRWQQASPTAFSNGPTECRHLLMNQRTIFPVQSALDSVT